MKFSHLKLEQIRNNPGNFKQIVAGSRGSFSMNKTWKLAIKKYHQANRDKELAFNHFEEMFDRNFVLNNQNRQRRELLLEKLERYISNYNTLGFEYYDYTNRVTIDINHGNVITGEIFRLDKTTDGLVVTLFQNEDSIWIKELRYPLLQIYYSNTLQIPTDKIKVGIYDFAAEKHEYNTFDELTLIQAQNEVRNLSNEINRIVL